MTLYTDIPTRSDIDALWRADPQCAVSLYVQTAPESGGEAERIAFKGAVKDALAQLEDASKKELTELADRLVVLEDHEFWRHQAYSLAVFATRDSLRTFRLPNRLAPVAVGGPRFFVKPLLRAVTFPQTAFVLALAQGSVRLLEMLPDAVAQEVSVPDMPTDLESAVGRETSKDRPPSRRVPGAPSSGQHRASPERQKLRIAQYSRLIDGALRAVLPGQEVPLVLAAAEPLDSIFRAHCSYPHLVPHSVAGNPEGRGDGELVAAARDVLDAWYADRLEDDKQTFTDRSQQGRASSDVADLARFATRGAVDTLFIDIDANVPGKVDDVGELTLSADAQDGSGDVLDEIARRAWFSGARLLAVRREDMPGQAEIAATLRYAPPA